MKQALSLTVSKKGDPFVINNQNEQLIETLCKYFTEDAGFNGDPRKGIILVGKPGVGKTHLMNFFAKNPKASFTVPTCKIIVEKYANKWSSEEKSTIEYYSETRRADFGHQWDQVELGTCFGDLGAETSDASSFGNRRNVIEEIVFNRYEASLPFHLTHFTTNLNASDIENKYGSRLRDRIREMCNVFAMDGDSWRK
jgi:DNA replication protein DnaC